MPPNGTRFFHFPHMLLLKSARIGGRHSPPRVVAPQQEILDPQLQLHLKDILDEIDQRNLYFYVENDCSILVLTF